MSFLQDVVDTLRGRRRSGERVPLMRVRRDAPPPSKAPTDISTRAAAIVATQVQERLDKIEREHAKVLRRLDSQEATYVQARRAAQAAESSRAQLERRLSVATRALVRARTGHGGPAFATTHSRGSKFLVDEVEMIHPGDYRLLHDLPFGPSSDPLNVGLEATGAGWRDLEYVLAMPLHGLDNFDATGLTDFVKLDARTRDALFTLVVVVAPGRPDFQHLAPFYDLIRPPFTMVITNPAVSDNPKGWFVRQFENERSLMPEGLSE